MVGVLICSFVQTVAPAEGAPAQNDKVVATVNGQTITVSQLDEIARPQVEPLKRQIDRITDTALSRLLDTTLLEQAAKSEAVSVEEYLQRYLGVAGVVEVEEAYQQGKDQSPGFPPGRRSTGFAEAWKSGAGPRP